MNYKPRPQTTTIFLKLMWSSISTETVIILLENSPRILVHNSQIGGSAEKGEMWASEPSTYKNDNDYHL